MSACEKNLIFQLQWVSDAHYDGRTCKPGKDLIAERRKAEIKHAQSEGKHCGRPIKATVEQVRELLAQGLPPVAVQDRLAISEATFYRLKKFEQLSDI